MAQARPVRGVNIDLSRVARMQKQIQMNCDRLLGNKNSLGSTCFQILNRVAVLDVLGLFLIDSNGRPSIESHFQAVARTHGSDGAKIAFANTLCQAPFAELDAFAYRNLPLL